MIVRLSGKSIRRKFEDEQYPKLILARQLKERIMLHTPLSGGFAREQVAYYSSPAGAKLVEITRIVDSEGKLVSEMDPMRIYAYDKTFVFDSSVPDPE